MPAIRPYSVVTSVPPPLPATRLRRRGAQRRIVVLLVSLILFPVGVVIGALLWPDSNPPDDSSHLPAWEDRLEDNPLSQFEKIISHRLPAKADPRLKAVLAEDGWDSVQAKELLEEHREVLEEFDVLAANFDSTWQWQARHSMAHMDHAAPHLSFFTNTIVPLVRIRSQYYAQTEEWELCRDSIISLLEVSHGMTRAKGSLIYYMTALTAYRSSLRSLRFLKDSTNSDFSDEIWQPLIEVLVNTEPKTEDLRFTFKVEYLTILNTIDEVKSGHFDQKDDAVDQAIRFKGFLKKNRTARFYLEMTTPIDNALESRWSAIPPALKVSNNQIESKRSNPLKFFVSDNAVGRILVTILLPVHNKVTERSVETVAYSRCWAWFLTEIQTGPSKLSRPDQKKFIATPIDPFTGSPLIVNKEERVIYSVGSDLEDNGGRIDQTRSVGDRDIGVSW